MKLFSKSLTATDCLKRLSIPKRVLNSLPEFHGGHAVELRVRYENETKEWPLVCTIRQKGYMKPVLSRGWRKFVVENRLNVGDELTFYKEEDDESGLLFYRVEVKRAAARPFRALSRSPSAPDPGLDESQEITSARSCNTYQKSAGITSYSPPYKVGFSEDDIASSSIHGIEQLSVDTNDVGDANVNEENGKSQCAQEQHKLFGAIIGGALVVDTSDKTDHKAYHNSLKQLGLSTDNQLDNGNHRASLIRRVDVKEETAARDYFSLGLTMGGGVVHVNDQATSRTSFHQEPDQMLGLEYVDMMVGQSIEDTSDANLELTLKPPILS